MKRILMTGMSGTGKSTVIRRLAELGYKAFDLDDPAWSFILDWEGAVVAPPEHDLFFFAEEPYFRDLFWPNYSREFEGASLNVDALGFYYYRRSLEDLAEWLERLVHVPESEGKAQEAIHWAGETLKGMSETEKTLVRTSAGARKGRAHGDTCQRRIRTDASV